MQHNEELIDFLKNRLIRKYIEGNEVIIEILGCPFRFTILQINPSKGKFTSDTELEVEGLDSLKEHDKNLNKHHLSWSLKPLVR